MNAVVLGSGLNALGVVRALGRHGLRIAVVSHESRGVATYSRFVSQSLNVPGDYDPAQIIETLGSKPGGCALFLTEELDVMRIAADPTAWKEQFRTYFYEPELALQLLSKSSCDALASEYGAPAPKTVTVSSVSDLQALDGLKLPCVLKPAERSETFSKRFKKAYRIDDRKELLGLLEQMLVLHIPLIVQEWIDGDDANIYFNLLYINSQGKLLRSFVGRKTLCWPPAVGGTAACMAAPQFHEALTSISFGFLTKIGFRGLIGIEYKQDARDGQFYLIEPTVYRTDYQHEVAALNGSDWLYAAYLDVVGMPVPVAKPYTNTHSWQDFPASRYSRQLAPPQVDYMMGSSKSDAHFRINDPVPGLIHLGEFFLASIARRMRWR